MRSEKQIKEYHKGKFHDSIEKMYSAIRYLRRHKEFTHVS